MMSVKPLLPIALLSLAGLTACGGSDDVQVSAQTAVFSFGVSDAPVTEAAKVVVCFSGIELVGNGLQPQRFTLGSGQFTSEANDLCRTASGTVIPNTRGIDLLTLQGANSEALIRSAVVPAGQYGQLRLDIAEGSYVERLDGSRVSLRVPSNQLRLNGPVLSAGGNFNYTLEFDLRKALVDANPAGVSTPNNQNYLLKPTGLRLVDNSQVGHLQGNVAEGFLIDNQCPVNPADDRAAVAAVYLYAGASRPLADLSDNGGNKLYQPYASTAVFFKNDETRYHYSIGFVEAGSYTVAITCDLDDQPEAADDIVFITSKNITIEARQQPYQLDFAQGD